MTQTEIDLLIGLVSVMVMLGVFIVKSMKRHKKDTDRIIELQNEVRKYKALYKISKRGWKTDEQL